jgi:hypothetical protein
MSIADATVMQHYIHLNPTNLTGLKYTNSFFLLLLIRILLTSMNSLQADLKSHSLVCKIIP